MEEEEEDRGCEGGSGGEEWPGYSDGGGPIRVEYGWGRIPPPSLPLLALLAFRPSLVHHRHRRHHRRQPPPSLASPPPPFSPPVPHSPSLLLLCASLASSGAPAAPAGYPRQVPARDSHGMNGDRYVRPTKPRRYYPRPTIFTGTIFACTQHLSHGERATYNGIVLDSSNIVNSDAISLRSM